MKITLVYFQSQFGKPTISQIEYIVINHFKRLIMANYPIYDIYNVEPYLYCVNSYSVKKNLSTECNI